jgi:hypothetical protein
MWSCIGLLIYPGVATSFYKIDMCTQYWQRNQECYKDSSGNIYVHIGEIIAANLMLWEEKIITTTIFIAFLIFFCQ